MRRYFIFITINLGLLLSSITTYAASVAIPMMTSDLHTSLIMIGWVLSGYSLVYTVIMPLAGKITEVLGKRTTFIACTLLFIIGSMLCALSPNIYFLIGSRIIQAIAGGAFMPCAAAITSDEFPESRQRFIGLLSSVFPIGMIIGPNLGGWMAETFGWRSIFWFNVPLGVIVLASSVLLIVGGGKRNTNASASIDFAGAGLLFGSLFAFMFGITEIGSSKAGIPWALVSTLFALGIGLLLAFLYWEGQTKEPIIDLELLKTRPFLAAHAYNFVYGVCALGIRSLIPLYAVSVYAMTTLQSGIILTPWSIGMVAATVVTSFFLVKWGYRWPILLGTLLLTLGFTLLALKPQGIEVIGVRVGVTPLLLIIMAIPGIGTGICSPAANNACIELMPDKVATIIGIRGMFRQLGSTMGVAIATFFLNDFVDEQRAFYAIMFASASIMLISLPTIFIMPASPNVSISRNQPPRKEKPLAA